MRDGERRGYAHSAGQFTQQDPIGIAGGANVYGFAGGDPVNFSDPFGLRDCRKVVCPSVEKVATDPAVQQAGEKLFQESRKDGKERGAFLFNGPDGSIVVGPTTVGEAGTLKMGVAPDDAIGMLHTHPDLTAGGEGSRAIPGGPPSGDDYNYARTNHVHGVVEQRNATFYIPWNNPTGVSQQRRSRPPRGSDQ